MKERLPQYMVPAGFVLMEKFLLNSVGKIDRKALPAFTHETTQLSHDFVSPRTETEKALAIIWAELLKVESVGVHDNFFDLGGHSLLAIKAASRIRDVFEVDLPAQILFENSTIAELAKRLTKAERSTGNVQRIEPRKQDGPYPLSSAQEQLWFLNQLAPDSPVYNVVDLIPLGETYNPEAIRKTVKELVRRHEILRTAFSYSSGLPDANRACRRWTSVHGTRLEFFAEPEREREWMRVVQEEGRKPFDLSELPCFAERVIHRGGHKITNCCWRSTTSLPTNGPWSWSIRK